jgi:hypothetical protein
VNIDAIVRGNTFQNANGILEDALILLNDLGFASNICVDYINNGSPGAPHSLRRVSGAGGTYNVEDLANVNVNNFSTVTMTGVIGNVANGTCQLPAVSILAIPSFYVQDAGSTPSHIVLAGDMLPSQNTVLEDVLDAILGTQVVYAQQPATIRIPFGTIPGNTQVSATFDVLVGKSIPPHIHSLSLQGVIMGNGFSGILSNDPDTAQASDPTLTLLDPLRTVTELPMTGEAPWWRSWAVMLIGLVLLIGGVKLRMRYR